MGQPGKPQRGQKHRGRAQLGTLALSRAARLRASRGSGGQFSTMVGSGGLRVWGRTAVGLIVSHEMLHENVLAFTEEILVFPFIFIYLFFCFCFSF